MVNEMKGSYSVAGGGIPNQKSYQDLKCGPQVGESTEQEHHYESKVCIPPQIPTSKLSSPMWWYLKEGCLGGKLVMRVRSSWIRSVPLKDLGEALSFSVRVQPRSKSSLGTERASLSILAFPAFRTLISTFLMFTPPHLCCYSSVSWWRQIDVLELNLTQITDRKPPQSPERGVHWWCWADCSTRPTLSLSVLIQNTLRSYW